MFKFWEWLSNKGKAGVFGMQWLLLHNNYRIENTPKQMLIGYMIEYCEEKNIGYEWDMQIGIDNIYNYLKETIEGTI